MPKTFLIDTSRCTACRGCQIACKEWKGFPAVHTKQTGTHQNPPDLGPYNYKLVRFQEYKMKTRVEWLFFPEQCRHCLEPGCKAGADAILEGAIIRDPTTGAIIFTELTKKLTEQQAKDVQAMCPYNIPRWDKKEGKLTKCDMCIDRLQAGMVPACVKTCCTGCMNFGERDAMLKLAQERLATVKKNHPKAMLLDPEDVSVIYLVTEDRKLYYEFAEARTPAPMPGMTRQELLAKAAAPLGRLLG
ncbi:MAG: formate dehydrogenase [Desulfovibrionaceae bacterium CG1_02_65_16]|nr:MAG: formate dehydrogenase [Desulfovibrionaceae bacterium CG1_02_65_16]